MDSGKLTILLAVVQQWQLCASENRYCQEAVDSVVIVDSCPTSKTEFDNATRRKNCSRIASKQNCGPVDQFVYHCVINGYRNETLEVCAPLRIIFGHCVEFNTGGGVIQDQRSSPCSDPFPKCDAIYDSWKAYKYPDCYKLVSMGEKTSSTTVTIPTTTTTTTPDDSLSVEYLLSVIAAVVFVLLLAVFVAVLLYCKRNQGSTKTKFKESMEDSRQVYGDDVEKTLRADESKTLINSDESDEMHQLDETQGERTKSRNNAFRNNYMHRMTSYHPKRQDSLDMESSACDSKVLKTEGKKTYSAGLLKQSLSGISKEIQSGDNHDRKEMY